MNSLYYFLSVGGLLVLLTGCQSVGKDDTETAVIAEAAEKQQETLDQSYNRTVLQNPTRSNHFFQQAAVAFQAQKATRATLAIREGLGAWNEEVIPQDKMLQTEKDDMLNTLAQLAQQVEGERVFEVNRLEAVFSQAELLGARVQLSNSQTYLSRQEYEPARHEGHGALARMAQAARPLGQTLDQKARQLMVDVYTLLDKLPPQPSSFNTNTLDLKMDSVRVFLQGMTEPQDEVRDVETSYRAISNQ